MKRLLKGRCIIKLPRRVVGVQQVWRVKGNVNEMVQQHHIRTGLLFENGYFFDQTTRTLEIRPILDKAAFYDIQALVIERF